MEAHMESHMETFKSLSFQFFEYMTFRSNEEKMEHQVPVNFYFTHLCSGTAWFFGVHHEDGCLSRDDQNPKAFDKKILVTGGPSTFTPSAKKWLKQYQKNIRGKNFLKLTMYEQLGILNTVSKRAITKAYRRVFMEHHIDRTKKRKDPNYLAVQKAFNTLMDPTMRAEYDSVVGFDNYIPNGDEIIVQHNDASSVEDGGGVCFYSLWSSVLSQCSFFQHCTCSLFR